MAVIQPADIDEEKRHEIIADAVIGGSPGIPGVECIREITPLVMSALQRANNPYITNRKGFEAIGIKFDADGNQVSDAAEFALAIMPKTAEVIVLLSCPREQLKQFAVNPAALQDAALDIMETATMEQMGMATVFVSEQLQRISRARATKSTDDDKPEAQALAQVNGKKKPGRTGSHKS